MALIPHNMKAAGDADANRLFEFNVEANPTSAYAAPGANGTWTKLTSDVAASLGDALAAAGYWLFEIQTVAYRFPFFTNT